MLEQARRLGTSEAELLRVYHPLRAEDLANAIAVQADGRIILCGMRSERAPG
jgi:uncharacterized protein (DUF433 family)